MAHGTPRISRGVFVSVFLLMAGCADSAPAVDTDACSLAEVPDSLPREDVEVDRVADGDTLTLTDGRRVRLIGINTPERERDGRPAEPFAERATAAVRAFVENSDRIRLVTGREEKDSHGRWLAHVFNGQGVNLEARLLARGLGWHVAVPPNLTLAPCLADVEVRARRRAPGVWQQPPVTARDLERGGFQRVRGRLEKVSFADAWWLSLEGNLAGVIYPEHQHRFEREAIAELEGEVLELQGWVYPSHSKKYEPWRMKLETPWGMDKP